jgi:hypothetical protein
MLGSSSLGSFNLGGTAPAVAPTGPAPVALLATRTAELVASGPTGAQFDRPAVSASFERADVLVFV